MNLLLNAISGSMPIFVCKVYCNKGVDFSYYFRALDKKIVDAIGYIVFGTLMTRQVVGSQKGVG